MRNTPKKAPIPAKKTPSRPKRKPARKVAAVSPAELAEVERTADILGAALAPAFAQAAPQPLILSTPSRWVPKGTVPQASDKPVENAAELTCLHTYRSPGPVRAAFVREVIDAGPSGGIWWQGHSRDPSFVVLADGETLEFTKAMFARYTPQIGDAFVLYPDGHTAFLPRAEFNACYGRKPLGLLGRLWRALA